MALFPPDQRPLGPPGALAAAFALFWLVPVLGAGERRESSDWTYESKGMTGTAGGTLSFPELQLRRGTTLLRATRAEASNFVDFKVDDSIWKLTGAVHVEVDGAVLDAQMATVTFADGRFKSIHVQPDPAPGAQQKPPAHLEFNGGVLDAQTATVNFTEGRMRTVQAQGAPAVFSHQPRNSPRRIRGRASKVDYDAVRNTVRISVNAWFSDGRTEFETQALTYNLTDGSFSAETPSRGTFSSGAAAAPGPARPDDRVPAPRTPDRASAP